jgi:hypothetical protein
VGVCAKLIRLCHIDFLSYFVELNFEDLCIENFSFRRREKASDPHFLPRAFMAELCLQCNQTSLPIFMIGQNVEWFEGLMLL